MRSVCDLFELGALDRSAPAFGSGFEMDQPPWHRGMASMLPVLCEPYGAALRFVGWWREERDGGARERDGERCEWLVVF